MSCYVYVGSDPDPKKREKIRVSSRDHAFVLRLRGDDRGRLRVVIHDLDADADVSLVAAPCGLPGCYCAVEREQAAEGVIVALYDEQQRWIADVPEHCVPPLGTEINGRAVQFARGPNEVGG